MLGEEEWKAAQKEREEAVKEGQRGGKGSLCGFESTVQQLPDKIVFPGTPQGHSARRRIMQCTNLSKVILKTSLSIVTVSCLRTAAFGKLVPTQYSADGYIVV